MALACYVQRSSRYAGPGCEHHLLLQVTRPSYPNAGGGAEEAAYAFEESTFGHLRSWFETWVLSRICGTDGHDVEQLGDVDTEDPLEGPGFRWLEDRGRRVFFLCDSGQDGDLADALA